ncbi:hypothetical protein MKS88_005803 [Plasmodium brasilianum]|uniref:Uncharacterized protein n=2 Tax=Plasmodium (Plasmodium) TaxID=418103 RepID=A0A1A8WKE9_PLAMA|nr:conserved Plasmodium protein, unknown function [Plasmodium malariae]KAI4835119.1 hypothetical protein MKS88_005803 [Plasmodium brasilianum]SBS92625.1 hypothetical protein, conserved in Apicomplexan species [Plasmodium malariae]SBT81097.1 conserved Plasmodium protein, unknown function [Plasmodium malariae]SCP03697.1 conserved Plasmodium protein, unknown function [Plasmodium malariae]
MSKPKVLLSQIKNNITDIRSWNLKGIESCKKKIFGYIEKLPGENNWVKPLIGKSMQNYYFPSKYLHLDFNLKEYLRMQTVRFKKKEIDDSLIDLQKAINIIIENKEVVDNFLSKLSKELYFENQSLRDFYSLYLTIFPFEKDTNNLSYDDLKDLNIEYGKFRWFHFNTYDNHLRNSDGLNKGLSIYENCKENISNALDERENHKIPLKEDQKKQFLKNVHIETQIMKNKGNYKKIIFTKTRNIMPFKKIICKEQRGLDNLLTSQNDITDKIYYLDCNVNIGLDEKTEKTKKDIEQQEESKSHFYNLINENECLRKTFSIRNRFIDPLYLRRRYSYIHKLTKKKIKKEKHKTYRKHFIQHADEKKIWPDNKGLLNKMYPNPYS